MFRSPTVSQTNVALLILRVIVGVTFLMHGQQKLFEFGLGGTIEGFGQMGAPLPQLTGPLFAFVETLGGLALIIGLLTRLSAFGLACDALGATLVVHAKNGFFAPMGVEFTLRRGGRHRADGCGAILS